jgi:hypothetical protein
MMMRKGNTMISVQLGNILRAYDFKPMVGRNDCFVEGEVIERNAIAEAGYSCYKIRVTRDVYDGQEQEAGEYSRKGQIVFVPWRVDFMEYAGRIMNLSE